MRKFFYADKFRDIIFFDDADLIFVNNFGREGIIGGNLREQIILVLNRSGERVRSLFEELGDGNIFQLGGKRQSIYKHSEGVGEFDVAAPA